MTPNLRNIDLKWIAAPMVNQSDLPFRLLVRRHGATATYTQMYLPEKLLNDQDYLEYHLRDLSHLQDDMARPVVAQLCGNDPDLIVQAGRKLEGYCDAIDLNLGCPQDAAREGHFGGYLLGQKDWQRVQDIERVSSVCNVAFLHCACVRKAPPVTTFFSNCRPCRTTGASGASWIALHARTVSARRRRRGAADLSEVKRLKEKLSIPVVSNGNVRQFSDLQENILATGADGLMVGETLLGNPFLFEGSMPDPVDMALEYLDICRTYPGTMISIVQTHIRHIIEFQCGRLSWFSKFRATLSGATSLDMIEYLLNVKVERWRGRPPRMAEYERLTATTIKHDHEQDQIID